MATTMTATSRKSAKKTHWTDQEIAYYEPNPYWSIAVFGSEMKEYQQISFVNSIFTTEGGSHVDLLLDNLVPAINDCVKGYLKRNDMKASKDLTRVQIKNQIFVIVRSLVVNPSFDSQTKVCLRTTKA